MPETAGPVDVQEVSPSLRAMIDPRLAPIAPAARRRLDEDQAKLSGLGAGGGGGNAPPSIERLYSRCGEDIPRRADGAPATAPAARVRLVAEPPTIPKEFLCRVTPRLTGDRRDVFLRDVKVKRVSGGAETDVAADKFTLTRRTNDLLVQFAEDGLYRLVPVLNVDTVPVDPLEDGCTVSVNSKGPLLFVEIDERAGGAWRPTAEKRFPFFGPADEVRVKGTIRDPNSIGDAAFRWDPETVARTGTRVRGEPATEERALERHDLSSHPGSRREGDALHFEVAPRTLPEGFHVFEVRASDVSPPASLPADVSGHVAERPPEAASTGKRKGMICRADEMTSKVFRAATVGEYLAPGARIEKAVVANLGNDLLRAPNEVVAKLVERVGADAVLRAAFLAAGLDARRFDAGGVRLSIRIHEGDGAAEDAWTQEAARLRKLVERRRSDGLLALRQLLRPRLGRPDGEIPLRRKLLYAKLRREIAATGLERLRAEGKALQVFDAAAAAVAAERRSVPLTDFGRVESVASSFAGKPGLLFTVKTSQLWVELEADATSHRPAIQAAIREKTIAALHAFCDATQAGLGAAQDRLGARPPPETGRAAVLESMASGARAAADAAGAEATARAETAKAAVDRYLEALRRSPTPENLPQLRDVAIAAKQHADAHAAGAAEAAAAAEAAEHNALQERLADDRAWFNKFLHESEGDPATWLYDTFFGPALESISDVFETLLQWRVCVNLSPVPTEHQLLLTTADWRTFEAYLRGSGSSPLLAALEGLGAKLNEAYLDGIVRMLTRFFSWLTGKIRDASAELAKAAVRGANAADQAGYGVAHEAYAVYFRMFEADSSAQYEEWRRTYDGLGEEHRRELDARAEARCAAIDRIADGLKSGADSWFEERVRWVADWVVEAVDSATGAVIGKVSALVEDRLRRALLEYADAEVRIGAVHSAKVRLPADRALVVGAHGVALRRYPFSPEDASWLSGRNPCVIIRDGELDVRYDINDLSVGIGGKPEEAKAKLGARTAESFVGGLELRFQGRPGVEFRDDGLTFWMDLGLSAHQPGLDQPCRGCGGSGRVERDYEGRPAQGSCHVCAGSGKRRRGRGSLLAPVGRPSRGGSGFGVNVNFANQVAYALWDAGLFDLSIPKGAHPLKDQIWLAAKDALAPLDPPSPRCSSDPTRLTLIVPDRIYVHEDFWVEVRHPPGIYCAYESIAFEVAGVQGVASSGELAPPSGRRTSCRARFRVTDRRVEKVTIRASAVRRDGGRGDRTARRTDEGAVEDIPVIGRFKGRTYQPAEASFAAMRVGDASAGNFARRVIEDIVGIEQILHDFSFTMQSTMPPLVRLRDAGGGVQETRLSWGDLVLDLDMKWKSIPVQGRVQVAFDAAFRAWSDGEGGAAPSPPGQAPKVHFRLDAFNLHVDFLTPLLGIDPDYIVVLLEYVFERIADRMVRATFRASAQPPDISLGWVLDAISKPRPIENISGRPVAERIHEAISQEVLDSVHIRMRDVRVNDAPGYLSASFGVVVEDRERRK